MELKDTVKGMLSSDYKKRFKAEYQQLKIRHNRLGNMLWRYAEGMLDFEPSCPVSLLSQQEKLMEELLKVYKWRAEIEGIDLYEEF